MTKEEAANKLVELGGYRPKVEIDLDILVLHRHCVGHTMYLPDNIAVSVKHLGNDEIEIKV